MGGGKTESESRWQSSMPLLLSLLLFASLLTVRVAFAGLPAGNFSTVSAERSIGRGVPTSIPELSSTVSRSDSTGTLTAEAIATCTAVGTPGPWTFRANYPEYMTGLAVASDGANIYGFAGRHVSRSNSAYKYNYTIDSWTPIASVPDGAGTGPRAEYGHNGKIFVVGGTSEAQSANRMYDIASNSWSWGAPVPTPVSNHGLAYWNGKVYVVGGGANSTPGNGVYAYDIASDTWSTLAPLPQAKFGMATAAINGKIYVANGSPGTGSVTNNLHIYDIATNSWIEGPPSPLASNNPAGTVIGGKFYLIGGSDFTRQYSNTYLYDPATNSWSTGSNLNIARSWGGAATIDTPDGETAIVVGGGQWFNSVEASTLPNVPCATVTGTPTMAATNTPTHTAFPTNTHIPTATLTPSAPTATSTPCLIGFTDLHPTDYFYEAVRYLYCRGIISGYSDNTFRPFNNTTRGQLTKVVVLTFGITIYTPPSPTFTDVPPTHTFYQYIETAAHEGLVSGYADGTFRPQNDVTRGQLSKIVVVAAGWPLVSPPTPTFSDVPLGSAFYQYVETAFDRGIISGYADGTFRPGNNATRGQVSKIVYQAISGP